MAALATVFIACGGATDTGRPPVAPRVEAAQSHLVPPGAPAPIPVPATPALAPLPAGLYFGGRDYAPACAACEDAKYAVLLGVFHDIDRALAAATRAPRTALGYPFLAHTDELGLADEPRRGVAVVLGFYRAQPPAQMLAPGAEVRALADEPPDLRSHPGGGLKIVRLRDGGPFPAGSHLALTHWTGPSKQQGVWEYCGKVSGAVANEFVSSYPKTNSPEPEAG